LSDRSNVEDYIAKFLPVSLLKTISEEFDQAHFDAHKRATKEGDYDPHKMKEVLGYQQHWLCEMALKRAGEVSGFSIADSQTTPKGGRYTLIYSDKFVIGRAKGDNSRNGVRTAKYRVRLSEMNDFISGSQGDFFYKQEIAPSDVLYGLFLSAAHPSRKSSPAYVKFAVPNATFTGWLYIEPIEKIIANLTEAEVAVEAVPDLATVKIREPRPS
jgi:hypothetical protein